MPADTRVTCDHCHLDITYTRNSVDYRVVVGSQVVPTLPNSDGVGTMVTDMMIYDPFPETAYFCSKQCLFRWAQSKGDSGQPEETEARFEQAIRRKLGRDGDGDSPV
jgi:hypothetical protein